MSSGEPDDTPMSSGARSSDIRNRNDPLEDLLFTNKISSGEESPATGHQNDTPMSSGARSPAMRNRSNSLNDPLLTNNMSSGENSPPIRLQKDSPIASGENSPTKRDRNIIDGNPHDAKRVHNNARNDVDFIKDMPSAEKAPAKHSRGNLPNNTLSVDNVSSQKKSPTKAHRANNLNDMFFPKTMSKVGKPQDKGRRDGALTEPRFPSNMSSGENSTSKGNRNSAFSDMLSTNNMPSGENSPAKRSPAKDSSVKPSLAKRDLKDPPDNTLFDENRPIREKLPIKRKMSLAKPRKTNRFVRMNYTREHDQGRGVIAADDIPKGDEILTERPIYSVGIDFITRPPSAAEERYCAREMQKLPAHVYDQLMAMTNQQPQCLDNNVWVRTPVSGTIRSNLIPYSLGRYQDRAEELGVFLMMSGLNHSCRPNATQTWNTELGKETLYALEDIEKGQQVTISYSPEARVDPKWIQDTYNFKCACRWCVKDSTAAKKTSEDNRNVIEELANELENITVGERALENCYNRALLIQKEGIVDWRKGLAFEDALDIMLEDFKDEERAKVLAVVAFLAYWKCEGWDTAKGADLGGKYAQLVEGMDEAKGKECVLEIAMRYIAEPDRGLMVALGLQEENNAGKGGNENAVSPGGIDDANDEPTAKNRSRFRTPAPHVLPKETKISQFDPDQVWEQLNAPIVRAEDIEVDPRDENSMLNYSSILTWLFMIT